MPSRRPFASVQQRLLASLLSWLLAAFAARGIHIDPDLRLNRATFCRAVEVLGGRLVRPVALRAAALLELLSRVLVLILFAVLSVTPQRRGEIMEYVRSSLSQYAERLRQLGIHHSMMKGQEALTLAENEQIRAKPHILVVGDKGVGKSALVRALMERAENLGFRIAEGLHTSVPRECYADVRVCVVVWEAALDIDLSRYVRQYADYVERVLGGSGVEWTSARQMLVTCNKTDRLPCPMPQIKVR